MKKLQIEVSEEYYKTLNPDECVVTAEMSGVNREALKMVWAKRKDAFTALKECDKEEQKIWEERQ